LRVIGTRNLLDTDQNDHDGFQGGQVLLGTGDRETEPANVDRKGYSRFQRDQVLTGTGERTLGFTEVVLHLDEALGQPDDAQVSPELPWS
jgi:hypothetical protein